jgi:hypothetical protein
MEAAGRTVPETRQKALRCAKTCRAFEKEVPQVEAVEGMLEGLWV